MCLTFIKIHADIIQLGQEHCEESENKEIKIDQFNN